MENKTEQQEVNDTIQDVEQDNSAKTTENKANSLAIWLIVLALICLNGGLYWLWSQHKMATEGLTQQLIEAQKYSEQVMQLEHTLQQDRDKVQQQLDLLQTGQSEFSEKLKALQDRQQLTNGDVQHYWALSEVEYLLNAANQRVLLAADVAGAQVALSLADERIKALSDYRLHPLRALLAEEQLALASVTKVDIDGMAVQLQSALDKVDSIQILMAPEHASKQEDSPEAVSSIASNWKTALSKAWQQVRSLVVIRHQQEGAAAVLVPEQRYFLYQNLRLKLETARLALLSGREAVFHASLLSAEQWLQQYFVGGERDALLELVKSLQLEKITVALPDISTSLVWLQQQGAEQ
ncbi:MAG: uroporphyrinogen-III C-methyltransferase [Gammaproteobacteria bacterium]|nr:uroporphyrinogen-III C-methyltransferase [Gammaproteobacteria bacterium]MDH5592258.1 uroporphyrinogen-III C-methyltransferase [Gammaproteobacteria bacterium]